MNANVLALYIELAKWRDEELENGNLLKARQIHNVIKRKKNFNKEYIRLHGNLY